MRSPGSFARDMHQHLDLVFVSPVDGAYGLLTGCCWISQVALGEVADRRVVGPVAPCGKALRRAINGEFRAADTEPVLVIGADVFLDVIPAKKHIRVTHDIDLELAVFRDGSEDAVDGLVRLPSWAVVYPYDVHMSAPASASTRIPAGPILPNSLGTTPIQAVSSRTPFGSVVAGLRWMTPPSGSFVSDV